MNRLENYGWICYVASIATLVAIISLIYKTQLVLWFAVPALILFFIELYRDKSNKKAGGIDFVIFALILIIIYKIFW